MDSPVALVTGAATGVGRAIATRLAADGWCVAVNHKPGQEEGAAELVRRITYSGGSAVALAADVSDEASVAGMADAVTTRLGPVSALVCNAAVSVAGQRDWREVSVHEWANTLGVNVVGAFLCARACYPTLRAAESGSIVVLSSVTPLIGRTGNLHYVTSKAALIGFTRALAREAGPDGVRVNAVAPGAIEGPNERAYGTVEAVDAQVLALQSLQRRGGADDVAGVVSFLCGPDADFVTGQLVVVDGGWVMH